ncbi:hypothetical protein [Roseateles oligotrophus]|uniref:Uncharacterized protein n=1 Tax=Roseateles oligotrophus TaxID=1769250 RepID=A0ABT2YA87_9BURK|nr:hypothetical protein [Roseateles oligotrophus]MCV2367225.1 hypothetical protein [Roseateles oligotrophus]
MRASKVPTSKSMKLVKQPLAERFVNHLWALEPPTGKWRYYNGLLQFMALLHVSGRFQAH